ncbi:MAG: hypothetical protein ACOYO7_10545, partial [Phycisphaerales bacterium]
MLSISVALIGGGSGSGSLDAPGLLRVASPRLDDADPDAAARALRASLPRLVRDSGSVPASAVEGSAAA